MDFSRVITETLIVPPGRYEIADQITVDVSGKLIIQPGVHLVFTSGGGINVKGVLLAVGEDGGRIIFEGDHWRGIAFSGACASGSKLEYADFIGGKMGRPVCRLKETGRERISFSHVSFRNLKNVAGWDPEDESGKGGAVRCDDSDTDFEYCVFADNSVEPNSDGGALYLRDASVNMLSCSFKHNSAGSQGGVICSYGLRSALQFNNCVFEGNRAPSGGALNVHYGEVQLTECRFISNASKCGGAIANFESSVSVRRCHFAGNSASSGAGGAVMCAACGRIDAENSMFMDNSAGSGGAIDVGTEHGTLNLNQCKFTRNTASGGEFSTGGAVHCECGSSQILSCTFQANSASFLGGAVFWVGTRPLLSGNVFDANSPDDCKGRGHAEACSDENENPATRITLAEMNAFRDAEIDGLLKIGWLRENVPMDLFKGLSRAQYRDLIAKIKAGLIEGIDRFLKKEGDPFLYASNLSKFCSDATTKRYVFKSIIELDFVKDKDKARELSERISGLFGVYTYNFSAERFTKKYGRRLEWADD